jgi:hypothetical protein
MQQIHKTFFVRFRHAFPVAQSLVDEMISLLAAMVLVMIMTMVPLMVVTMEIAVVVAVPVMIMLSPPAVSVPIARKIMLSVVTRCNPASSLVWRPSPIAFMPLVVPSQGIPISFHPDEIRIWPCGQNESHPDRGWRSNHYSDRNLRFAR